ncbi:NADH-quinone oxidoreductase subunit L [Limnochorda pilosa]|uniref:NADH-quinone oxidoreductase subunit L n=1 Tax=Limnochorda pilosa TaxID=1555112 RepID=A0A0K2SLH5_LIMPI|nr:NADH-quinone oxidoreductase subunit L [Limnochorda pilosa]BAS27669.1 NADH-quinone oxidoreductase subunit L [Limnochorda pilosa]
MVHLAWLVPLLPLLAWLYVGLPNHRDPSRYDRVGIGAVGVAFLLSLGVLWDVAQGGRAAASLTWAVHGSTVVRVGYQVDPLTALMLVVVTLVSLMVQLYSLGYMHGDRRYKRYYAVLSLFTFAMLGLVMADNLLLLYIFWELVGLSSYLLIGHWYEDPNNARAANKAFLTTRAGDVGMFIGIMLLFTQAGTFQFTELGEMAQAGLIPTGVLTLGAVLLFAGAVGKSAQFPLHVWLPDAMAGPTPVSALIHAATMVAAGVYLVGRAFPIFEPSATAMLTVAWIGGFTAIFAATIALVQADIKKVLAYSTVSQLGYMMLGLGLGGYTAGLFHLTTHAFFKALLFLASGSVIHAVETQDMHQMGGLMKKLPVTAWTWIIGSAALAGIPPLAGFWSKDEILLTAFYAHPTLFWIGVAAAAMTAFYITRATWLTFFGAPRDAHRFEHAHESPAVMTVPLVVLAVLAATSGLLGAPQLGAPFARFIHFGEAHHLEASSLVTWSVTGAWLLGLLVALAIYAGRLVSRERIIALIQPVYALLKHRYYVDEAYDYLFVKGTILVAYLVGWIDRTIVDGIVNGVAALTRWFAGATGLFDQEVVDGAVNGVAETVSVGSRTFRRAQTGLLQSYVLAIFVTVVIGLAIFVIGG